MADVRNHPTALMLQARSATSTGGIIEYRTLNLGLENCRSGAA